MQAKYRGTTYYLVRHGEAANSLLAIVNSGGGLKEYPLTELGRRQAIEAAEFLSTRSLDLIVASPVLRARETAEVLREHLHLDLSLDQRLCEPRFGTFEDQSYQSFVDYTRAHGGRMNDIPEQGIEGYVSIRKRVNSFLLDAAAHYPGKHLVIVSHGDTLQQMNGELLGLDSLDAENNQHWYPKRGSVTILTDGREPETFVPTGD